MLEVGLIPMAGKINVNRTPLVSFADFRFPVYLAPWTALGGGGGGGGGG